MAPKGARAAAVLVGLVLLPGLAPFFMTAQASPNPVPILTMALSPSGVTASPSDFAPGAAQVSGTLSVDKLPGERFTVMVTGQVDTGWSVQCSPSILLFTTNKVNGFTATIVVPAMTPASLVGILRIEARGQGSGFVLHAVSQAIVTVAPFYKIFLDSPAPYREVPPGSKTDFLLQVINWGNSLDTFDLYVINQEELTAKGWAVTFSTSSAAKVGAGESKYIRLFVQTPRGFTKQSPYKAEGTTIDVQAVSQNSRDTPTIIEQVYYLIVYQRGTYIDESGIAFSVIAIAFLAMLVVVMRKVRRRRRARRLARRKQATVTAGTPAEPGPPGE